ncbi:MAG: prolipoprotein diacylglyceryl transferase [Verrucomicrobiae bacterium]|nr:prolipoprotein diacylglyceryl transferase [Verrucomicrobiae bacterium]
MHPIAFNLGSYPVHSYGVMMALAFLAGLVTATRRARLVNVHADIIADVTLWLMVGGIVGARVVYVTTYWKTQFAGQPLSEIFMVQHGGLVYYGGLIGSSLAGLAYLAWKKAPVWKIADILAPSIALGSVFGRIGCLLNGCCYGYACSVPWAIHFPADHETGGAAVHPTEIYDALLNLILYLGLAWLFRHRRKFDGQIFAIYLMVYAIFRSIAESFRGDYPADHIHDGITSAQLLSIPMFAVGLGLYVVLARRAGLKRG